MTRSFQQVSSFVGGEVSPRLRSRTGTDRYRNGCEELVNFIVHPQGGAERRMGLQVMDQIADDALCIPFRQESNDLTVVVSKSAIQIYDGANNLGAFSESPYADIDLDELYWAQDEDALEIVTDKVAPHRIRRTGGGWVLEPVAITSLPQYAFKDFSSPGSTAGQFQLIFGAGWEKFEVFALRVGTRSTSLIQWGIHAASLAARIEDAIRDVLIDAGQNIGPESVSVDSSFNVVLDYFGGFEDGLAVDLNDSETGTLTIDDNGTTTGSSGAVEDAWSDARGWPRTVVFHDQRKLYGGTRSLPATLWGSRIGFTDDFTIGQDDDDAFSFRLKSQKTMGIRWLSSKRLLAVGTTGGDVVQFARPLTPTSVQFDRQTAHQSAPIMPIEANSETFYTLRGGRKVYSLLYEFDAQGWQSVDVTFPSEHITKGVIRQMDYADQPDGIVWCVLKSGELAAMTYERTQQVVAWHRHKFAGAFRSVAVVHRNGIDQIWFTVEYAGRHWVARLPASSTDDHDQYGWTDLWMRRENATETNISPGFVTLEGETVRVTVDGADAGYATVQNGVIAVEATGRVFYAGLDYSARLVTNAYEGGTFGTSQVAKRRWSNLVARLLNSVMPKVNGYRPEDRSPEGAMDTAEPLFSGDVDVEGTAYEEGKLVVEADSPGPCHITGLFGVMTVGQG